jgi:hypothetical protein
VGSNTAFPGSYLVCYLYYALLGSGIIAGAVLWAYFLRHGLRSWTSARGGLAGTVLSPGLMVTLLCPSSMTKRNSLEAHFKGEIVYAAARLGYMA